AQRCLDRKHVAHRVAANGLKHTLGGTERLASPVPVVHRGNPLVALDFLDDAAEWVALEGDANRVVRGLDEVAVRRVRVTFLAAVAVLDRDDAPDGVVAVPGLARARAAHARDAARGIALVNAPEPVEAVLFDDVAARIEHEPVDGAMLVVDRDELLFGVVLEAHRGAGLGAGREAPHALVGKTDVVEPIAGTQEIALAVVDELTDVAVRLVHPNGTSQKIALDASYVPVRVGAAPNPSERVVRPTALHAIGRDEAREVAVAVVAQ